MNRPSLPILNPRSLATFALGVVVCLSFLAPAGWWVLSHLASFLGGAGLCAAATIRIPISLARIAWRRGNQSVSVQLGEGRVGP